MTPQKRVCFGWKGVRPGVRLESRTVRAGEEPEEHKWQKMTQPNPSPNSFMQQSEKMRREPEVPEERVPAVECLDGHARITSKELAPIHSVKSGTLQNACSTRPRVVADLGKSARMHTARLMNSLVKGLKRMMAKVQ